MTRLEHVPDYCAGSRWDDCCCEDGEWQKATQVAELDQGREQAFYHVLVDAKDWEASWESPPVAYVAEELLQAPEVSCKNKPTTSGGTSGRTGTALNCIRQAAPNIMPHQHHMYCAAVKVSLLHGHCAVQAVMLSGSRC